MATEEGKSEKKEKKEETTTILVTDEGKAASQPKTRRFPVRLILIWVLLLAAGIFLGIIFRLALR